MKFQMPKLNTPESDVDDEFAVVATNTVAGVEAKGINHKMIISVTCTPLSGLG